MLSELRGQGLSHETLRILSNPCEPIPNQCTSMQTSDTVTDLSSCFLRLRAPPAAAPPTCPGSLAAHFRSGSLHLLAPTKALHVRSSPASGLALSVEWRELSSSCSLSSRLNRCSSTAATIPKAPDALASASRRMPN